MERQKEKVQCILEKKKKIRMSQNSAVKPKQPKKNQTFINTWQVIMGVFQEQKLRMPFGNKDA